MGTPLQVVAWNMVTDLHLELRLEAFLHGSSGTEVQSDCGPNYNGLLERQRQVSNDAASATVQPAMPAQHLVSFPMDELSSTDQR